MSWIVGIIITCKIALYMIFLMVLVWIAFKLMSSLCRYIVDLVWYRPLRRCHLRYLQRENGIRPVRIRRLKAGGARL